MLEVEIKAQCGDLEGKLLEMGAEKIGEENHEDVYFNSPFRDFRKTDEALRVREADGKYLLTYKGPRTDPETKTREEIEIPTEKEIIEILKRLGFSRASLVRKSRKTFKLKNAIICLDDVENLGNFVEIESRNYGEKDKLFGILEELGIGRESSTTKSYLELLEGKE
jgi:adenylate cyclase class 2